MIVIIMMILMIIIKKNDDENYDLHNLSEVVSQQVEDDLGGLSVYMNSHISAVLAKLKGVSWMDGVFAPD